MRKIGKFEFPENVFQAEHWEPFITWQAIDRQVLVVARTRIEGKWCAYVGSVEGDDHKSEVGLVLDHGSKLPEPLAKLMFPLFDGVPYAE